MKQLKIFLLMMLLCAISVNGQNITITGQYGNITVDYEDYCYYKTINYEDYDNFVENKTFKNIIELLILDLEPNFKINFPNTTFNFLNDVIYKVKTNSYEYKLIFTPYGIEEDRIGSFRTSSLNSGTSTIYLNNIITRYNDRYNYNITNFNEWLEILYNVILHETSHFQDIGVNGFTNRTNIFNLYNNYSYFENIYYNSTLSLEVPIYLKPSLNFTRVYEIYEEEDYYKEIVARVNSICLNETSNLNFTYDSNYNYCQEFNFNNDDLFLFNELSKSITQTYFLNKYPNNTTLIFKEDYYYCKEFRIANDFTYAISNFNMLGILNFLNLIIFFSIISFLISFCVIIIKIIENIKKQFK